MSKRHRFETRLRQVQPLLSTNGSRVKGDRYWFLHDGNPPPPAPDAMSYTAVSRYRRGDERGQGRGGEQGAPVSPRCRPGVASPSRRGRVPGAWRAKTRRRLNIDNIRAARRGRVDEVVRRLLEGVAEAVELLEHLDRRARLVGVLRARELELYRGHAPVGEQLLRRLQHLRLVALAVDHRVGAEWVARGVLVERVADQLAAPVAHHADLVLHPGAARQVDLQGPRVAAAEPAERQLARQPVDPVVQRDLLRLAAVEEGHVAAVDMRERRARDHRVERAAAAARGRLELFEQAHRATSSTTPSLLSRRESVWASQPPSRQSNRTPYSSSAHIDGANRLASSCA